MSSSPLARMVLALVRYPPEPADPAGAPGSLRVVPASPRFVAYRLTKRWAWLLAVIVLEERLLHDPLVARVLAVIALVGAVLDTFLLYLEYQVRSYKLTDRAMRLREGLFVVNELTMTFANVQNVTVSRGPLQGIFGISDVVVQSAGGGGARGLGKPVGARDMHTAHFRGLTNAEEVRELVMTRLRRARDAGLGDVDEAPPSSALAAPARPGVDDALRGLVAEARAFREAAEQLGGSGTL